MIALQIFNATTANQHLDESLDHISSPHLTRLELDYIELDSFRNPVSAPAREIPYTAPCYPPHLFHECE
jgi:hypothetical protein